VLARVCYTCMWRVQRLLICGSVVGVKWSKLENVVVFIIVSSSSGNNSS